MIWFGIGLLVGMILLGSAIIVFILWAERQIPLSHLREEDKPK